MSKDKQYISLKEAAKISGYSPDYVGQLIRGGRLSGKQVFLNVAWMTTEEAILEYLQKEKKGANSTWNVGDLVTSPEVLARIYAVVAWIGIGIMGLFIVFLISVFAISIDNTVNQKYLQEAADNSSQ